MKQTKKVFSSFQKRISISFVLLTAVFVLLTAVAASAAILEVYRAQTGERLAFEQQQLRDVLNRVAQDANDCANNIVIQLNTDRRLSLPSLAKQKQTDRTSTDYILTIARGNLRLAQGVNSINIMFANGMLYTAEDNYPTFAGRAEAAQRTAFAALAVTTKGRFFLMDGGKNGEKKLYYCKQLRDISTNTRVGFVYLKILPETLRAYCVSAQDSSVVLTDTAGNVIVSTGSLVPDSVFDVPAAPQGSLRFGDSNANWRYETGAVGRTGWQLTCLLNEDIVRAPVRTAVSALIASAVAVLGVMALLTVVIARRIARPIGELSRHMASSAGNLPMPLSVPHESDEIDTLYASFNSMLLQNHQLFDNYKAEQRQKNRTELALMQSQIKPHFLYNTLDTIYCLASMNRAQEASTVTKALADYYRLVLNHGEEKITIESELAAIECYLSIMQVRYRDMFSCTIGCDEAVKQVIVPKLLLQPLVENAIYHGIKPKRSGTLDIYAAAKGELVELTVTDDGVGMTPERFAQALAGVHHEDDSETFGMHNVVRRLQLFYGENSRMELRTSGGKTTVAIIITPSEARDV